MDKVTTTMASITRVMAGPVFVPAAPGVLAVPAGTIFVVGEVTHHFADSTVVLLPDALSPGRDYVIRLTEGALIAEPATGDLDGVLGGFHFALGGNAAGRAGGDSVPAINPYSCWDLGWRPTCPDPRGMACVDGRFWADIYLTGVNALKDGSSVYGADIADGRSLPLRADGKAYPRFDYEVATAVMAALGKTLLSIEDFFAAAFGVTEATSAGSDPVRTGLDAARTSKWGLMQATGNMTIWGHDGDPDGPRRAALLGGYWSDGGWSGSRSAWVTFWPGYSDGWFGARGRSDHLALA